MGLKPRRGRAGTLAQYFLELGVDFALGAGGSLTLHGQPTAENADTVVASPVCPLLVSDE